MSRGGKLYNVQSMYQIAQLAVFGTGCDLEASVAAPRSQETRSISLLYSDMPNGKESEGSNVQQGSGLSSAASAPDREAVNRRSLKNGELPTLMTSGSTQRPAGDPRRSS